MIREVHRHPVVIERLNARPDYQKLLIGLKKVWKLGSWYGNGIGSPNRPSGKLMLDAADPAELVNQATRIAEVRRRIQNVAKPKIQRRLDEIGNEEEKAYRKSLGLELTHPDPKVKAVQQGVIDGELRSPILLKLYPFYAEGTIGALPESLKRAIESSAPGTGYSTIFEHHVWGDERLAIIEHYFNRKTDVRISEHVSGRGDKAVWRELTAPQLVERMEQRMQEAAKSLISSKGRPLQSESNRERNNVKFEQ